MRALVNILKSVSELCAIVKRIQEFFTVIQQPRTTGTQEAICGKTLHILYIHSK